MASKINTGLMLTNRLSYKTPSSKWLISRVHDGKQLGHPFVYIHKPKSNNTIIYVEGLKRGKITLCCESLILAGSRSLFHLVVHCLIVSFPLFVCGGSVVSHADGWNLHSTGMVVGGCSGCGSRNLAGVQYLRCPPPCPASGGQQRGDCGKAECPAKPAEVQLVHLTTALHTPSSHT